MYIYIYICINIHIQCTFADTSVCFCYACHLPSHYIKKAAFGRFISAAAPLCGFLFLVAGQVASITKKYRRISKCALNMYIDTYISHIPLESLSSQYHPIPSYKPAPCVRGHCFENPLCMACEETYGGR